MVGVADGDTLTVLDGKNEPHKIRLSGIDAPEKSQTYGQRSKQSLSALAYSRSVSVEWRKQDRYQGQSANPAGRAVGSRNKASLLSIKRLQQASVDPLEELIELMTSPDSTPETRLKAAIALMPYRYSKVELKDQAYIDHLLAKEDDDE